MQPMTPLSAAQIRRALVLTCPSSVSRPLGPPRRAARRRLHLAPARKQGAALLSEADLYVSVPSAPDSQPSGQGTPWYVVAPVGFVALIACLRVAKAISRRNAGSLEARNLRGTGVADDVYYSKMMRNMKKVQYEELSDEAISAARRRRSREVERDAAPDIDEIELPDNHPFAVKQTVSQEEEELQRLRLSARRGLSPEDMRALRQQQALADRLDAEGDARDAERRRQQ